MHVPTAKLTDCPVWKRTRWPTGHDALCVHVPLTRRQLEKLRHVAYDAVGMVTGIPGVAFNAHAIHGQAIVPWKELSGTKEPLCGCGQRMEPGCETNWELASRNSLPQHVASCTAEGTFGLVRTLAQGEAGFVSEINAKKNIYMLFSPKYGFSGRTGEKKRRTKKKEEEREREKKKINAAKTFY